MPLYRITMTCELDMVVEAKDEKHAEEVALDEAPDCYREGAEWDPGFARRLTACPPEWRGALPWGGDGRRTVDQILATPTPERGQ